MNKNKEDKIRKIIDDDIKKFADNYYDRYKKELKDPDGVINSKKNNQFISIFGDEFMFYSAFCRSFDSSFGNLLEKIANHIAEVSYDVINEKISSYIVPTQMQTIETMISEYEDHSKKPEIIDYNTFELSIIQSNISSFEKSHVTDNHFYNPKEKEHYIIELKAGGDLDNKKSKSEKIELLKEYFLLKNSLKGTDETIKIFFATAYNKDGEGNDWNQERVKQYFAEEELLIGKDYWNFVCDDSDGYNVVYDQYLKSSKYLLNIINKIRSMYF